TPKRARLRRGRGVSSNPQRQRRGCARGNRACSLLAPFARDQFHEPLDDVVGLNAVGLCVEIGDDAGPQHRRCAALWGGMSSPGRLTMSSGLTPSAYALKLVMMGCRNTGAATALTSSHDT